MPTAMIEKYADDYAKGKRMARKTALKKLEEFWEEAKLRAEERGFKEGDDRFYAYVTGIWKRMTGLFEATASSSENKCIPITIDINTPK